MALNIYDKLGYIDIPKILKITKDINFCFIIGGRGTGKTYSTLREIYHRHEPFMYLRRTREEYEICSKPENNPFKRLMNDGQVPPLNIEPISKGLSGIYETTKNEDGEYISTGAPIGFMTSMQSLAKFKGSDLQEIVTIVYDEFIPESHMKKMKGEYLCFCNAYESICRNREFEGRPGVKMICLANAVDIGNPIFVGAGLVKRAEQMMSSGKEISILPEQNCCLVHLSGSPISERKKHTSLYRFTAGGTSEFNATALQNRYYIDESAIIKSCRLVEYVPIASINNITIYKHKSEHKYYVSPHKQGAGREYGSSVAEKKRFITNHRYLWNSYLMNHICFEEYSSLILFEQAFDTHAQ